MRKCWECQAKLPTYWPYDYCDRHQPPRDPANDPDERDLPRPQVAAEYLAGWRKGQT